MKKILQIFVCLFLSLDLKAQTLPNPIVFCTQVPQPTDFTTIMSTFGNHLGSTFSAPRGGDLYIKYPDGTLKNLTLAAGLGQAGLQGANSIAVRDPAVHWNGTKIVFSMVKGSAINQYQVLEHFWQIYEITGLGKNETPVVTLVPNQPNNYNNIQPIYGTDDRIIFTSDMPLKGLPHLYPQHDEYESSPTVSGIWKLDPTACTMASGLQMLTHAPSGDFTPSIDHNGRLIFTRWDHLKRDQQADGDIMGIRNDGTFNYSNESATALKNNILPDIEVFPEPRAIRTDLTSLPQWANTNPQDLNVFNPWMMNEDGSDLEMLNHLGRHDMGNYMTQNFTNDPNLTDFYSPITPNPIRGMFHIKESPVTPGVYYGIDAMEFSTHGSGMVVKVTAPVGRHPEQVTFDYITHPSTRFVSPVPDPNHSGMYRNPTPLTNGNILVSHSPEINEDRNIGTVTNPISRYNFRIRVLEPAGNYMAASNTALSGGAGITKSVSWWSPDQLISYNGVLWEYSPVEVYVRPRPVTPTLAKEDVEPSEQDLFAAAGVNLSAFRKFLRRNELSVLAIRDVTSRDDQDRQQPFNLKVAGTNHQTINPNFPNTIYEVKHLQFLQNDLLRGIGGINTPKPGRRGIPQFLHDSTAILYNPPTTGAQGSTNIHADGSAAMIVPAKRALTWQLTDVNNKGIVRERLWLSTKPGEIRTCTSCHGESTLNQAGQPSPSNVPQALTTLLNHAKTIDSDNDGVKDIYDAYPKNPLKHVAEAVDEKFVNNLANWLNQNTDNDAAQWSTQTTLTNATSAVINNRAGGDNTGKIDRFRKLINLNNFDGASLTFDVAYARYDASKFDKLRVWILKCDGTQQLVYDKSGTALATAPDQNTLFLPTNASQWRKETIDLSAYAGKNIELVFENVGGYGNQLFLDNILIVETAAPPPCPNTLNLIGSLASGQYKSSQTILSQGGQASNVQAGNNVDLSSGKSILLQAGFEVQRGSVFKASIGGCN